MKLAKKHTRFRYFPMILYLSRIIFYFLLLVKLLVFSFPAPQTKTEEPRRAQITAQRLGSSPMPPKNETR